MCEICDGTGGITINNGWYAEFEPCPAHDCGYDKEAARKRDIQKLKEILRKCEREPA